jgi:alpha-beta hydrolase superfamily lysophospholipase
VLSWQFISTFAFDTMPLPTEHHASLQAADGTLLYYREWLHPQALGAVVMLHGLGEHGGRYDELAALFYAEGLSVRMHDHRGHGRSAGARGSLRHSEDYLNDLLQVFQHFATQTGYVPMLFGHSMGGLLAARFATGGYARVRALILSSPALGLRLSRYQRWLLAVSTCLAPGLAVPSGLPTQAISHDASVVRASREDKFNHGKVAARVVNFMLAAITRVHSDAGTFAGPLLLQVAGNDTLVDPEGSRIFFTRLGDIDKTLHYYPDAYHEIFNESPEYRLQAQQDLRAWLKTHQ